MSLCEVRRNYPDYSLLRKKDGKYERYSDMEDGMKKSNIHLSRVSKVEERKNGAGAIF